MCCVLILHTGIKGRGEYVRLMFEDAGVPYVDAGVEQGEVPGCTELLCMCPSGQAYSN